MVGEERVDESSAVADCGDHQEVVGTAVDTARAGDVTGTHPDHDVSDPFVPEPADPPSVAARHLPDRAREGHTTRTQVRPITSRDRTGPTRRCRDPSSGSNSATRSPSDASDRN